MAIAVRPPVSLGPTDVRVVPMGVGTWAWGDRRYWGYGERFGPSDVVDAFAASLDAGLDFFDTAEVYGHGESEKILGWMVRKHGSALVVATKFAPLPDSGGAPGVGPALERSLKRLGLPRVDLYQVHWCDTAVASVEDVMNAMAETVHAGLARTIGVSNFSADETVEAHTVLARHGIPLASNQVRYSLMHRAPETNGVLETCRALGATLLAYSPLEQGILAGKYSDRGPSAERRAKHPRFSKENLDAARPVLGQLREIGDAHGDRPVEHVALAWLLAQPGVVPLAGATTGAQAASNAAALTLQLEPEALSALDRATARWK